jgi:hypothetical protein
LGARMSLATSLTPLRYPIPNPMAQPATAQPKTTMQIRAAPNAQAARRDRQVPSSPLAHGNTEYSLPQLSQDFLLI